MDGLLFIPNMSGPLSWDSLCTLSATSRQSGAVVGLTRGWGFCQHRQGYDVRFTGGSIAVSMEGRGERGAAVAIAGRKGHSHERAMIICISPSIL